MINREKIEGQVNTKENSNEYTQVQRKKYKINVVLLKDKKTKNKEKTTQERVRGNNSSISTGCS